MCLLRPATTTFLLLLCMLLFLAPNLGESMGTNIGLVVWGKVAYSTLGIEDALVIIAQMPTENRLRHQVDGTLYWIGNKQEQATALVNKIAIAEQLLRTADLFANIHKYETAERWLHYLETTELCRTTLWFQRGRNAESQKQWETAIHAYRRSTIYPITDCDWYGNSDAFYRLGVIYQQHKADDTGSIVFEAYTQATQIDDFTNAVYAVDAYYQLGLLLFRMGSDRDAEAITALREALQRQPTHKWALLILGRSLYRHNGDFKEALSLMRQAHQEDKTGNWLFPFYIAELYYSAGLPTEAMQYYGIALETSPDNKAIQERMASLHGNAP